MRFLLLFSLIFCGFFCAKFALADAHVCVDQQGKKVFLDVPCEKRGMKVGTHDFPVAAGQSINARIFATDANSAATSNVNIKTPVKNSASIFVEKRNLDRLDMPVVIFLASMIFAIMLMLCIQIFLFLRAYYRPLRVEE